MTRVRLRDLGIVIGELPTGVHNAITDVPGVWVGHTTLIYDEPRMARTGVTVIRPRFGEIYADQCFAGYHSFNGNGEMTGLLWMDESGQLGTPIAITNTHQVGVVRDALVDYEARHHPDAAWLLPVVAETYDGWLNDINGFHITHDHVFAALDDAAPSPVEEGNVGGGTGMICHDFKGNISRSSNDHNRRSPAANSVHPESNACFTCTARARTKANYATETKFAPHACSQGAKRRVSVQAVVRLCLDRGST